MKQIEHGDTTYATAGEQCDDIYRMAIREDDSRNYIQTSCNKSQVQEALLSTSSASAQQDKTETHKHPPIYKPSHGKEP